jgi:hypothetical protein
MPRTSEHAGFGARRVGLLVLGACTVWLVIQNTLLFLAMMWGDAAVLGRVAMAVVKAGALVAAGLLLLVMRARPASSSGSEARHG